jgi:hypothetical protein
VHPITKQLLFVQSDDGEEKIVRIQSSEMCCILITADARDKKELYEDVFESFMSGEIGCKYQDYPHLMANLPYFHLL